MTRADADFAIAAPTPPRCLSIKSSLLASLLRFAPNLVIRDCDEEEGRNGLTAAMLYCAGVKEEELALDDDTGIWLRGEKSRLEGLLLSPSRLRIL